MRFLYKVTVVLTHHFSYRLLTRHPPVHRSPAEVGNALGQCEGLQINPD